MLKTNLKSIIFALSMAAPVVSTAENRIDVQRPDAPELAAYGKFEIGVRQLEIVNSGQIDILKIDPKKPKPAELPRYDRALTLEVWYPAAKGASGTNSLDVFLRDGKTQVNLTGKAKRDAAPDEGKFPLVLISHGYPGNRFLLSHLAENVASKGYVVVSIDHSESTYRNKAAFGSTLVNRSHDQLFTLGEIGKMSKNSDSFLNGLVDVSTTGLIGYSMGGYGAVISAGGGVTQKSVDYAWGGPHGTLGVHLSGSDTHNDLPDARIKTAIAFAPWGMKLGFWDAESLKGVNIPMMFVAGSVDDVAGYKNGVRAIWKNATNVDRSLLTYDNANHNAGAPIPAPEESFKDDADLGFNVSEHYTDAVWNTTRMNNIAQHFITAWLDKHLKSDASMNAYLDLVPNSNDGVWAAEKDGTFKPDHNHWKGFAKRTAKGLRFETLKAGQ